MDTLRENSNNFKLVVELFVKAAPQSNALGACLISQQWFMTFYCLFDKGYIDLRVTPMSFDAIPENYKRLNVSRHLPVAWIVSGTLNGVDVYSLTITNDDSIELLMRELKCPNLNLDVSDSEVTKALKIFQDLYINLIKFLKSNTPKPLLEDLSKLDDFLVQAKPFVLGTSISYVDCQLMPKLQHIRVVGREFKNFDIPENFLNIWKYVKFMYTFERFTTSCPNTRNILIHYEERNPIGLMNNILRMDSEILTEIPNSVLHKLQ